MKKLKLITLDFETYWAADYSLSLKKYNTSSYIRDPQFMIHGCGVKIGAGKTVWMNKAKFEKWIKTVDWSQVALLAHNNAFDGAILAWIYDIVPALYYDTLSMTRGLHNEVSRAKLDTIAKLYQIGAKSETYLAPTKGLRVLPKDIEQGLAEGCIIDVDLCYEVFQKQMTVYPVSELALIDLTLRMFITPQLMVNIEVAEKALAEEMREREFLIVASGVDPKTLTSNEKFAKALGKLIGDENVPRKFSKTTGKETWAFSLTDEEFLDLLEYDDRKVARLVAGRIAAKSTIFETRALRLIDAGRDGQRLPVLLNYFGAKTGRWSGGNKLNMQNLPRLERTPDGDIIERGTGMLRLSIIAPPNHVIVVADSAQIEARTIAWLAGQADIVELFARNEDVYCHMASIIYGRKITKKDKLERFIGKIAVLGLGYGMGPEKFQTTLALGIMGPPVDLTIGECRKIVMTFRRANDKIVKLWKIADEILKDMVYGREGEFEVDGHVIVSWDADTVWLPNGMGLHYPELRWNNGFSYKSNGKRKKIYGGLLVETIVQALARILVSDQMLDVADYLKTLKLRVKNEAAQIALMTHDEIVSVVPARFAQKVLDKKCTIMKQSSDWAQGVPLGVDGGFDVRYSK